MTQVNIHEAKTNLSKLIEKVLHGEDVIIKKSNKPIVKLVMINELKNNRKLGSAKGQVIIADDFYEPLEDFEDYQ